MKDKIVLVAVSALFFMVTGCEWETTGNSSFSSWNSSYNWVNFSGTYRHSTGGLIVGQFSGTTGGGGGGGSSTNETVTSYVIQNDADGMAPPFQTELSGNLDEAPTVVPGSVTIVFSAVDNAQASGAVTDNGGGVLAGTFNVIGIAPPNMQATGTINYDTGIWTLQLDSPGFLVDVNITVSYVYTRSSSTVVVTPVEDDDDATTTGGGNVFSLIIHQTGNRLVFTDNNGYQYHGTISGVSTTGGNTTGETSGTVVGQFQVTGGLNVTIVGTLNGSYTAMENEQTGLIVGSLSNRTIQGTWVEASGGTGDVNGVASGVTTGTATALN